LGVLVANLQVWRALNEFANANATASYVVLIPLVALGLILHDRHAVFVHVRTEWKWGLALVAAGVVWMLVGLAAQSSSAVSTLPSRVLAMVLLWNGGFVLLFGRDASRRALFPLLFLTFTVPIPELVLASAVQALKKGSTEAVALLFSLTGTVYYREGFVFSLPGVMIEIADECSGIRSSIGLFLTALLAGHLFLENLWTRVVLLLVVLPMAILKNAIRIVVLTLLSVHVDAGFLTGQLHHEGGIVFFLLALALSAPILMLLRIMETTGRSQRPVTI
jgi:exosortase